MEWIRSDIRVPTAEDLATGLVLVRAAWGGNYFIEKHDAHTFDPDYHPFWFLATDPTVAPPATEDGDAT